MEFTSKIAKLNTPNRNGRIFDDSLVRELNNAINEKRSYVMTAPINESLILDMSKLFGTFDDVAVDNNGVVSVHVNTHMCEPTPELLHSYVAPALCGKCHDDGSIQVERILCLFLTNDPAFKESTILSPVIKDNESAGII